MPNEIEPNEIEPNEIEPNEIEPTHSWDLFHKYVTVMNEYLIYFSSTEKFKKRDKDCIFLLFNGFTTLTHVFKIVLNHTTIDKAIKNMESSIYYYTQFIEQIEENIIHDLNVSSTTASLFVYNKTINTLSTTTTPRDGIKNLDCLLLIYRTIFELLLDEAYNTEIPAKLINIAIELCRNNTDEYKFRKELKNIMLFINHFPRSSGASSTTIYDHIYIYIKKYKHYDLSLERLCQKKIHSAYDDKLKEPNYTTWLLD
jgi:hypothetical protein